MGAVAVARTSGLRGDVVEVDARAASGEVCLQGAHVTRWRRTGDEASSMWLSSAARFESESAIRGGVPICFPWFGGHRPAAGGPSHGLARLVTWTFDGGEENEDGSATVRLHLDESTPAPAPGWQRAFRRSDGDASPLRFRADYEVRFGASLVCSLRVENRGETEFGFEAALHSYYRVSDIESVRLEGLQDVPFLQQEVGASGLIAAETESVRFHGELDRVYDACAPHTLELVDEVEGRALQIAASGNAGWVVWNPWVEKASRLGDIGDGEWRTMVCVEPLIAGADTVWLRPGEAHVLTVESRVL